MKEPTHFHFHFQWPCFRFYPNSSLPHQQHDAPQHRPRQPRSPQPCTRRRSWSGQQPCPLWSPSHPANCTWKSFLSQDKLNQWSYNNSPLAEYLHAEPQISFSDSLHFDSDFLSLQGSLDRRDQRVHDDSYQADQGKSNQQTHLNPSRVSRSSDNLKTWQLINDQLTNDLTTNDLKIRITWVTWILSRMRRGLKSLNARGLKRENHISQGEIRTWRYYRGTHMWLCFCCCLQLREPPLQPAQASQDQPAQISQAVSDPPPNQAASLAPLLVQLSPIKSLINIRCFRKENHS